MIREIVYTSGGCIFLGRNGTGKCSGLSVTHEPGSIRLEPLTSRGKVGRAVLEIPPGKDALELALTLVLACECLDEEKKTSLLMHLQDALHA